MKAYEFPGTITQEGKLELPSDTSFVLPREQLVRVIILVPESMDLEEKTAWSQLTAEQFLAGYSEDDAIYDEI